MTQIRTGQITPSSEAWSTWVPTLTGITIGNGSVNARYMQIGKTVFFQLSVTFGSTTSITTAYPAISLPPITPASPGANLSVGMVNFNLLDNGIQWYYGQGQLKSGGTTIAATVTYAGGTYVAETGVSSTVPFTWGTGDIIYANGFYEAA